MVSFMVTIFDFHNMHTSTGRAPTRIFYPDLSVAVARSLLRPIGFYPPRSKLNAQLHMVS